jgi:hypothetical protein
MTQRITIIVDSRSQVNDVLSVLTEAEEENILPFAFGVSVDQSTGNCTCPDGWEASNDTCRSCGEEI